MNFIFRRKTILVNKFRNYNYNKVYAKFKKYAPFMTVFAFGFYFAKKKIKKRLSNNFSASINKYLHSILTSKEIENDGINLMNKVIAHPKTKLSLILLVKGALKDKEISQGLISFSNNLITDLLQDKKIQSLIQNNLQMALQNKLLKNECINLIQYILNQERMKEISTTYMLDMFERNEIKKSFTNLVMESAIDTMKKKETKKKFSEFISDIWSDSSLRWNIFKRALQFWTNSPKH